MRRGLLILLIAIALWSFETVHAQPVAEPTPSADVQGPAPASVGDDEVEPVCVVTPKARLRVSPSTNAKISWVVGQHMPLERLSSKDGWSRVRDLRGQVHWVISKAVAANEACAVVRVRTAPLHAGPGPRAPRADFRSADRYTAFKRVDRESGWVRVEDSYRGTFWTQENNLWIPIKKSKMAF